MKKTGEPGTLWASNMIIALRGCSLSSQKLVPTYAKNGVVHRHPEGCV
jgi:hypothetical protein